MRVVQLLPELNEGGVERGVVELNRELYGFGLESIVISNGGKFAPQINTDFGKHYTLDIASKNPLTAPVRAFKLFKLLQVIKPDIIHARSRVPAWLSLFANKNLKIPFITTVHGFNSVSTYSSVMTKGDHVVCVSQSIKEYIKTHYNTPDEKISVIPRGIDLRLFDPNHINEKFIRTFIDRYSLKDRYIISVVGRITQLKDIETVMRAVNDARNLIPNITLLIVGNIRTDKQNYYKRLLALQKELNLEQQLIFTGPHQQVAEIYSLSDVVISASKKPESFGRSAAEAIAMNTPVIATNHGGMLDIVISGKTGLLFKPGDSQGLAQSIIAIKNESFSGMREFINQNFSLNKMVNSIHDVYQAAKLS